MNYDMSSYFEDPEFKEALAKYEGMVENHTPAYFEADELIDIAEYYTLKGRHKDADKAIDLTLQLHPENTDALVFRIRSLMLQNKKEEAKVPRLMEDLFNYYRRPEHLPEDMQQIAEEDGCDRAACDYIAGMTDRFAVATYQHLFIPQAWELHF